MVGSEDPILFYIRVPASGVVIPTSIIVIGREYLKQTFVWVFTTDHVGQNNISNTTYPRG